MNVMKFPLSNRGVSQTVFSCPSWLTLFLGSLLFSLTYQLPDWPAIFKDIYGYPMIDRSVYAEMIYFYNLSIDYTDNFALIAYFTLEFVWNYSLSYLNRDLGISTTHIFFFITTFVLWRNSYEVAKRSGWAYAIFLINPLVVDLALSQLRIAFAITVISFFWRGNNNRLITIAAYIVCTSIHTATILFAIMHFAVNKLSAPNPKGLAALCLTGFLIAATIGPLREAILGIVDDRRASDYDMSSTPLYLSFWAILWGVLVFNWKRTMTTIEARYSLIILSVVVTNFIFKGYPSRFIAVAFPFIIIAMHDLPARPVRLVTLVFIPYMCIQWMYWLLIL